MCIRDRPMAVTGLPTSSSPNSPQYFVRCMAFPPFLKNRNKKALHPSLGRKAALSAVPPTSGRKTALSFPTASHGTRLSRSACVRAYSLCLWARQLRDVLPPKIRAGFSPSAGSLGLALWATLPFLAFVCFFTIICNFAGLSIYFLQKFIYFYFLRF